SSHRCACCTFPDLAIVPEHTHTVSSPSGCSPSRLIILSAQAGAIITPALDRVLVEAVELRRGDLAVAVCLAFVHIDDALSALYERGIARDPARDHERGEMIVHVRE